MVIRKHGAKRQGLNCFKININAIHFIYDLNDNFIIHPTKVIIILPTTNTNIACSNNIASNNIASHDIASTNIANNK